MHRQLHGPVALDPNSETLLVWEEEGFPQTGCVAVHLTGHCDDHALERALFRAMDDEPFFHAHLELAWQGGRNLFLWRFETRRPGLEVYDHTSLPAPKEISLWFYDRMEPILGRSMRLETEFPVRFQLHHLPGSEHLFMFLFHHVVADAERIHAFLRETFAGYHKRVKSVEPPWASASASHAAANEKKPAIESWPRYFRNVLDDTLRYPLWRVAVPAGDGDGTARRRMLHVEIADENLLAAMKNRGRRDGGGLSDLLLASADLAVEEWNRRRGIASEAMLNFLAVNQRGRQPDSWAAARANPMGSLPIPTGKEDRKTPELFLKKIIGRRRDGLARGLDVRFTNELLRILGLARRLPFATRKKLLYPLLTPRNTLFLSNAGIIWPSLDRAGRPSGDSAIVEAGDLEILDFYLSLGCVRTWPFGLVAQSFRRKLYLEFLSCGNLFTEKNIADFKELFLRKIADYL